MTTIKELADELGVTKQAIRRHVNKLPPRSVSTGDNKEILIDKPGADIIRKSVSSKNVVVTTNLPPTIDTIVDTLTKQLEQKDKQIEALQQSLNDTTEALKEAQASARAAQALHAGTMQQQLTEPPAGEVVAVEIPAEPISEQEPRRGFSWWPFGRKK